MKKLKRNKRDNLYYFLEMIGKVVWVSVAYVYCFLKKGILGETLNDVTRAHVRRELKRFQERHKRLPWPYEYADMHRGKKEYIKEDYEIPSLTYMWGITECKTYEGLLKSLGFTEPFHPTVSEALELKVRELKAIYQKEILTEVNDRKYRVDFMVILKGRKVILEIDGSTHFNPHSSINKMIARRKGVCPVEMYKEKRQRDISIDKHYEKLKIPVVRIEHTAFLYMDSRELKRTLQSANVGTTIIGYTHATV